MSDPSALSGQALAAIAKAQTRTELEAIEMEYLGRKSGQISTLLSGIGKLDPAERAALGQAANEAKKAIEAALSTRRAELEGARLADIAETEAIDITFPGPPLGRGHIHVLTQVRRQIETILESLGYQVEQGPEVETEWYNFEALNLGADHPARESWDSFYFTPELLRDGASAGAPQRRHRPDRMERLRVGIRNRAHGDAQARRRRHPAVLRVRPPFPGAVLGGENLIRVVG